LANQFKDLGLPIRSVLFRKAGDVIYALLCYKQ
jgi:hypothetical protein